MPLVATVTVCFRAGEIDVRDDDEVWMWVVIGRCCVVNVMFVPVNFNQRRAHVGLYHSDDTLVHRGE